MKSIETVLWAVIICVILGAQWPVYVTIAACLALILWRQK